MAGELKRTIEDLQALAAADPPNHACDLAWAYSSLSNIYGQSGLPLERIGASAAAVAVLQQRVATPSRTAQELRDLPLLLDNLSSAYFDAGRYRDAVAAAERGIRAEVTAVEVGARSADESHSVMESLRDARLSAACQQPTYVAPMHDAAATPDPHSPVTATEGDAQMFLRLPEPDSSPTDAEFNAARAHALEALESPKLARYYSASGNYAGTTFTALGVHAEDHIGPDDLCAITLLGVEVSPRGVRTLLSENSMSERIRTALGPIAPRADLRTATASDFAAMWELQSALKAAIGDPTTKGTSNPWVTVAKISARKRPSLIPVRDSVVGNLMGKRPHESAYIYWQLMRALLLDGDVSKALADARAKITETAGRDLQDDFANEPDLRLLDAALWMHAAR